VDGVILYKSPVRQTKRIIKKVVDMNFTTWYDIRVATETRVVNITNMNLEN